MRVDRIFEGGTLLTMDPARPRATALAVLGGRIVAVGDGDELRRHLDAERVVSLQGRTVVPGFHDAHNHMPAFGMGLAHRRRSPPRRPSAATRFTPRTPPSARATSAPSSRASSRISPCSPPIPPRSLPRASLPSRCWPRSVGGRIAHDRHGTELGDYARTARFFPGSQILMWRVSGMMNRQMMKHTAGTTMG